MRSRTKQKAIYFNVDQTLMRRHHIFKLSLAFLNVFALILTLGISLLTNNNKTALAASYTWDGGGTTNNWSECANWSTDVCPVAADSVTFNGTSTKDSIIDASWGGSLTGLTVAGGYTGTITMARSLTMSGDFSQTAGNFTAANQTLDLNSSYTFSAGSFTASSGVMSVASGFTISGGTFHHNNGTLTFDSSSSATISCNNATFNLVTTNKSGTSTTLTVSSDCNLPLGNDPSLTLGNTGLVLNGALSGSNTLTISTRLTINSTGLLSGFTGFLGGGLTIAGGATNLGSYASFTTSNTVIISSGTLTLPSGADLNSSLIISGGTFNAPSGNMTIGGALTITGTPIFNHNSGIITFDGSFTLACNNVTFNMVILAHTGTSGIMTVNSDCSLPLGTNPSIGNGVGVDVTLNGILTGSGNLKIGLGGSGNLLLLNSSASLNGFSGLSGGALTLSSFSKDFSSYDSFALNGTYTQTGGTITLPAGATLASNVTINSGAVFNGGSGQLTVGNVFTNNGTVDLSNSLADFNFTFLLNSGSTFIAPSSIMTAAGVFTINSGANFNHNDGTIIFDGGGAAISCNNATFNLVTFTTITGGKTVSSNCTLPLGDSPIMTNSGSASIILNGTLSGTGTLTSGPSFTLNSGSSLSGFSGLVTNNTFILAGATLDLGNYTTVDINSTFTLNSEAIFTAPSDTMTAASAFTVNTGATFSHNNGKVVFDGISSGIITCNNTVFHSVSFAHTNNAKTVSAGCNLPVGDNPIIGLGAAPDLVLNGTLTGHGVIKIGDAVASNAFTINSTGILSGFTGLTAGVLNIAGPTFDASTYTTFNANVNFTLSSGAIFTAPVTTMSVGRDLLLNPGTTFNANGGTLNFHLDPAFATGNLNCNNAVFNLVTFTHPGGYTKNINANCNLPLGNNPQLGQGGNTILNGTLNGSGMLTAPSLSTLTLNSTHVLNGFTGLDLHSLTLDNTTFTAPNNTMSLSGNLTVPSNSTFNSGNGTVVLDGTEQTLTGDITFNNLTKTTTFPATLTFAGDSTQTIEGNLTLTGSDENNYLSLVSSTPGTQWNINSQGQRLLRYLSVQDSNNINGSAMLAYDSQDLGNSAYWEFLDTPLTIAPTTSGQINQGVLAKTGNNVILYLFFICLSLICAAATLLIRKRYSV